MNAIERPVLTSGVHQLICWLNSISRELCFLSKDFIHVCGMWFILCVLIEFNQFETVFKLLEINEYVLHGLAIKTSSMFANIQWLVCPLIEFNQIDLLCKPLRENDDTTLFNWLIEFNQSVQMNIRNTNAGDNCICIWTSWNQNDLSTILECAHIELNLFRTEFKMLENTENTLIECLLVDYYFKFNQFEKLFKMLEIN